MSPTAYPDSLDRTAVYPSLIDGLPIQSGDLICTTNGVGEILVGEFWRLLGRLVPGEVDHVAFYLGPKGLCVEAGPRGTNLFTVSGETWDAQAMRPHRGAFVDLLVGIAYPLAGRGFSLQEERRIRLAVRRFCLRQAQLHKPYNINFLNPNTDRAFYCSQLPYRAYIPYGINLNTGLGVPNLKGSEQIIFPQEIWEGCVHRKPVASQV